MQNQSRIFSLAAMLLGLALTSPPASAASGDGCCVYPNLPAHVRRVEDLVPNGWRVEIEARGVLDDGRHPAVALLLREGNAKYLIGKPAEQVDTNPRILAVALVAPDGGYDLVLQNHTLIPRLTADDQKDRDYELGTHQKGVNVPGVEIQCGSLRIHLNLDWFLGNVAANYQTYKFRFEKDKFFLIGYDSTVIGYNLQNLATSIDYLNHKMISSPGSNCAGAEEVIKNCKFEPKRTDLPPGPLLSLEDVGNGIEFQPKTN